jgi:hypothetical protein
MGWRHGLMEIHSASWAKSPHFTAAAALGTTSSRHGEWPRGNPLCQGEPSQPPPTQNQPEDVT